MHRINKTLSAILLLCLFAVAKQAFAWSEGGHKVIGSIAFQLLSPAEQERIVAILKRHPRFEEDFKSKMPDDLKTPAEQNEWLFQQAAIWPDLVRVFTGDDLKTYHRQLWHYIAIPLYPSDDDRLALESTVALNTSLDAPAEENENMNIVQALQVARRILADRNTPAAKQAIMLCWVLHLVGDIHQPLHSTSLFTKATFSKGDYVGNSIKTEPAKNLHATWDQAFGTKTPFQTAHDEAAKLIANAELAKLGKQSAGDFQEKDWIGESRQLAISDGYTPEVTGYVRVHAGETEPPPLHLTADYLNRVNDVSEKRVVQAGYRLNGVLKEIAGH